MIKYILKCLFLVLVFMFPCASFSQDIYVSDVVFEGNHRITTNTIKKRLKISKKVIDKNQINKYVKELYAMSYFSNVRVSLIANNILKFELVEKPVLRKLLLDGNSKLDDRDLKDALNFDNQSRFIDKNMLDNSMRALKAVYQFRGFYDAKISYTTKAVENNQVDVTFNIKEGKRYKIRKISFQGLKEIDEKDLLDTIQTKKYKWWSSWLFSTGRLNQEMLENDRELVIKYFMDHGFITGNISKANIQKDGDDGINVSFKVKEGVKFYFGKIDIETNFYEMKKEDILGKLKIKRGDVFSAEKMKRASFIISDILGDYSYAFANIEPRTTINKELSEVNVSFTVEKGRKVKINKINITGNDKTYDNVIRREFVISEGENYSSRKVKRSETLLRRLGYFSEVNVATSALDDLGKVDLDTSVKESSTGSFSVGVGYSTSDGMIFNTRFSENNLFGTGRSLMLDIDVGTERNNATLSFLNRRLNDSFWSLGMELLATDREYSDFDKVTTGGAITLGYPLEQVFGSIFEDIDFSVRYELLNINIRNIEEDAADFIKDERGKSVSSSIKPALIRNTLDNNLNPSKGTMQKISFEFGGLGGDEEFYIFEASNTFYYPLVKDAWSGGDITFSMRTDFGYGEGRGGGDLSLFKRYFLGGINSVRGFKPRTLGPKDANGSEYGGAKQFVNNIDLIFPFIESAGLRALVFYDMGQAFDDNESIDFGELRKSWGWGFRWVSPLGPFPLRLEFGYPIDKEDGESSMVTMFSFGAPL
ncbi:MAG: outer membrane protein assembly factor BamA [Bdellovibrionota bacterium]